MQQTHGYALFRDASLVCESQRTGQSRPASTGRCQSAFIMLGVAQTDTDRQDKGSKGSCCVAQPREGYEMDTPEKLDEAKKRKDAGNGLFKQAKYACCHRCLIASS